MGNSSTVNVQFESPLGPLLLRFPILFFQPWVSRPFHICFLSHPDPAMAALSLLRGQSVAFALTFFCSFCIAQSFIDASSNTTSALAQSTETLTESFVSSSNIQSASTATQTISSAAISSTTDDGSFLASIASNDSTTAGAQTTDLPDLGTMNTSSTSSMVSPATFATASNFSVSTTTTSSSSSTSPQSAIGSFEPIGCVGPVAGETGLQLASKRVDMTINRCLSKCAKSSYAGLFDTSVHRSKYDIS